MGCTSSTPSTLSAIASKEDNSTQIEDSKHDGEIATESENRTEIKVLPPSDTTELVKLVRNNKSTASLEPEKDLNRNGHIVESKHIDTSETTKEPKEPKDEEKDATISKLKLEEVVGKFIVVTQQDTNHDHDAVDFDNKAAESAEKDNEVTDDKLVKEPKENDGEIEKKSEQAGDPSPGSQSSRATRWEALADIAAELPPSLTVDPITGQIYSLSK